MLSLLNPDIVIVISYLFITLLIGFRYGRQVQTISDYAVADRNYHDIVIIAAMFSTMVGGFSAISVASHIQKVGIVFVLASSGWVIQNFIDAFLISKNLHKFKECISCGDMIKVFYGKNSQIIAGIAVLLTIIGSISVQIMIMGYLFEYLFNIDSRIGLIISTLVVIIYSAYGGIKAITMTDLLQFSLVIIAMIIFYPIVATKAIAQLGGYHSLIENIPASHLNLSTNPYNFYLYLLPIFISNLIPFYPEMTQRILINKNGNQFKRTMLKVVSLEAIFVLTVTVIGLAGAALYPEAKSENIIPLMIKELIPVGLKGLVIAGLFAIIMSTVDSMLNTAAVSVSHDIIGNFKDINPRNQLKIARIVTIILGIFAIIIALKFDNMLEVILSIAIIWSCTFKIPLCAALFNIKIPEKGLIFTVIVGFLALIIGQLFLDYLFSPLLFGIITNFLLFFSIYFLFTKYENNFLNRLSINLYNYCYNKLLTLKNFKNMLNIDIKSIIFKKCHQNAYIYHNEPRNLAVYTIISWFIFLGNVDVEKTFIISFIRSSTGLISFFLFFHDIWVEKYKKYFPIYWFFSLIYILVFIPTTTLLSSKFDISWFINYGLCLLLLAMMTNGKSFIYIFIIGSVASFSLCNTMLNCPTTFSLLKGSVPIEVLLLYLLVIIISAFFIRNKESRFENQIKSLAAKLKISKNISEEALKIRKEIFKNFSHELNIPFQSMSPLIDFTKEFNNVPLESLKNIARGVEKNMEALAEFVHDLNNVINTKNALLKTSNKFNLYPIDKIIRDSVSKFNKEYNYENDYKISIENNNKDIDLICNYEKIEELIIELLSNSVKFSKPDSKNNILITVSHDNNYILLTIADTGTGIPENELLQVFEPLETASNNKFNTEIKGMGLSICKSIVTEHNGSIWAENSESGLIVSVRLPLMPFEQYANYEQNIGLIIVNEEKTIFNKINISTGETSIVKIISAASGIDTIQFIKDNINEIDIAVISNSKNVPFLQYLLQILREEKIYQNIYKILL